MSQDLSERSLTESLETGAQELGQPVPESNLVSDENSGALQQTQAYRPGAFSFQ